MISTADRFTQIEASLALCGLEISPSEVHGTVVGAVANHLKSGQTPDLLKLIKPGADENDGRLTQLSETLYEVYRDSSSTLLDGSEGFELLLPDDEEPLAIRVEAVASWARGYVLGLLYNDTFGVDQIPESGAEIARDFMQIAEAAAGADDEKEEDWALSELQEYLKVGAQLIFEFIYSERADAAPAEEQ